MWYCTTAHYQYDTSGVDIAVKKLFAVVTAQRTVLIIVASAGRIFGKADVQRRSRVCFGNGSGRLWVSFVCFDFTIVFCHCGKALFSAAPSASYLWGRIKVSRLIVGLCAPHGSQFAVSWT